MWGWFNGCKSVRVGQGRVWVLVLVLGGVCFAEDSMDMDMDMEEKRWYV
jgi:hypothetical protein